MLRVTINGSPYEFDQSFSVLAALRSEGIEIPTLCHDDRLRAYGGCRLCVVQIKGLGRPVTACTTPLADGMEIETHSPEIEKLRRTLLNLLARGYPEQAVVQWPDKEFHCYLRAYGVVSEGNRDDRAAALDASHPYIHIDMTRCIDCYRCVRICEEVQGQFVWRLWNRGGATRILPDSGTSLRESSCVSCGACVDTCPTGALEDKSVLTVGIPTKWTKTTCPYCGTGCEMFVGCQQNRIVSVRPVPDAPVSRGHLCVKGRYAFDFVHSPDRVTEPLIRHNGRWQPASWDEAVSFVAEQLRRISRLYGPHAVGVLGSARATNEENYLTQKFARVVLGTNNVDCCARVCHAPSAAAMNLMLGTGAATNSFADIERADTILICGANPTENHPVVGARIKQAALRGVPLIVIDPRQIQLARHATCHLPLRAGTNVALLNAMACTIVERGLYDEEFLNRRTSGWEQFRDFILRWPAERAAKICGVDANLIRNAAQLYATHKPAMSFHGLGTTEHEQGTEGVMCLVNLALLTGNLGKPGAGINPLRGQNNVQGAAHMGCDPKTVTGGVPTDDPKGIFQNVWHSALPTRKGLNLVEMMEEAERGNLRALWTIGYDIFLTNANAHTTARALRRMDCVIVQDMFLNETAKEFGSIFLPAVSSFEKDGTFMNSERRIQRVRKAIEPIGHAKSDWEIICGVAAAMGKGDHFTYPSAEGIWNEVRAVWEAGAGISYPRLEKQGLQWPCPSEDHPGTEILHTEEFPVGECVTFRSVEYRPSSEIVHEEFPFLLNTGRSLFQFNAGTMTMRTENASLLTGDFLYISPEDARRLDLADRQRVRVCSLYGDALLPIRIDPCVKAGSLFATFHSAAVFLNRVTSSHADTYTSTPTYKVTAVRIEKQREEKA